MEVRVLGETCNIYGCKIRKVWGGSTEKWTLITAKTCKFLFPYHDSRDCGRAQQ